MSNRNHFRNSLSKNLMQMKFMQRTKDKNEKDLKELNNSSLLDEEYNESVRKEGQKIVVDNSYLYCERLTFGRMSFKGMNPEIEKIMAELDGSIDPKDQKPKNEESYDVNDEEMTNRYSKYMSDSNNRKRTKFSKQNQRSDKRFKHSNK